MFWAVFKIIFVEEKKLKLLKYFYMQKKYTSFLKHTVLEL
jgi:hypothetical protein